MKGECAVMETDKMLNWVRGRGLGRRCRRSIKGTAPLSMDRMDDGELEKGKGKEIPLTSLARLARCTSSGS